MQPSQMVEITRPHVTVSDKIRALNAAGVARADIARFLKKRYQHVRNVLVADEAQTRGVHPVASSDPGLLSGPSTTTRDDLSTEARTSGFFRLVVDAEGRLSLPQTVIKALGIGAGDVIIGRLTDEDFFLTNSAMSLRRAQALVRSLVPPGVNLSDELIADRRRDAAREEARSR